MLVCYVYFVISSTLLDVSLGRGDLKSISDPVLRREHYEQWFVNLKPFHTVKTIYIDALKEGYVTFGYVVFNALGNLLILAPLSILIPAASQRLGKPYFLLPILLASTLAIEALQYAFMRGSCDVDDVIFNFIGALAVWGIAKIPPISRLIKKLMFPAM
jgi:glycopeptide antibiotics resistance protein